MSVEFILIYSSAETSVRLALGEEMVLADLKEERQQAGLTGSGKLQANRGA